MDEDADNMLKIFETLSDICRLKEAEKMQALPIMLRDDALSFFSDRGKFFCTYYQTTSDLHAWYNIKEKKG